ncbi:SDR family oxidoreductase [Streptomyces sp. CBG31]|uniref:SDR family oxidoreductase n=1 Tax=Streptomyces sp. CBG31 TaxID=2762623 RepID=UPI001EFCA7D2|nr:SDR family oxidoreductase [Streptomyces sp. CBG31]
MTATSAPVLVTGGTGTLGSHVVPLLRAHGLTLRLLSRTPRTDTEGITHVQGDLVTGEGVAEAVRGMRTVVHLAGGPKGDDTAARNLAAAAAEAGVTHLVYISVIGVDTMPLAWFRTLRRAEEAVTTSGVPYSVLRAAQFHDLVLKMAAGMTRLPVVPAPGGLRFEPVDAREVAARLVELTLGAPAGLVPDLAGPCVYDLAELVRGYLAASGRCRPLLPLRMPGKAGRAYRAGENLALDGAGRGRRSWEEFLAERVAAPAGSPVRPVG